jgi:thiol-disulfide isomerase/thioredoxin
MSLVFSFFLMSHAAFSMAKLMKNEPYSVPEITNEQYDVAVASKKPLFLSYNATWCPSCQKQNKSLGSLVPKWKESVLIYTVNWDQKDKFKGPKTKQRTTIAYIKDGSIKSELIGETDAGKIEAFINSNLK